MARITGSHLVCKALQLEGVKNIFGLAGDHILPLLDVMADQDFRIIDTRHEQAAVHMADAWSRITEQPGVCMYTTPGFANAIPGLTNAMHTEGPVISIAGCADAHDLGRGAQQEIDQVAMAAPMCKGSFMVPDARRIPEFIARAMRLAFSGRRGPVHLTIPIDVQEQSVEENEIAFVKPEEYRPRESVTADAELVRRAIALLREARRPLAIAGCAAGYTLSGDALQRFVETTRVPVVTEEQARGLIPDDHPYAFGFFERGLNRAAAKVRDADVVVLLGRKQDFVIGFCRPPHVSADAKIIQIDPSPLEIGRNRGVAVGMVGDVTSVLDQLTKEASTHAWKELPWIEELRAVRAAQAEWTEKLARPQTPMHALFVHKTIQSLLRPDDCLVFDGGDFLPFRAFLVAGAQAQTLALRLELRHVGLVAAPGARRQSRVSRLARDHAQRRRRVRFQCHGVRHRGAPQTQCRRHPRQRFSLGHRPANSARSLRSLSRNGFAPDPLRASRAGVGRLWRICRAA